MTAHSKRLLTATVACLALASVVAGAGQGAPAGSLASSFRPLSTSFFTPTEGWVLGTASCAGAGRCLAIRKTVDGGKSWTSPPLPTALVKAAAGDVAGGSGDYNGLSLRFADQKNGWIFGGVDVKGGVSEPALWSTHDGGAHWRSVHLSGISYSILDLEASDGVAHLIAQTPKYLVTVESSPAGSDRWHVSTALKLGLPAGGADLAGSIVLYGGTGWLVEGNDRGITGAARLAINGRWVAWTPPCASVGGGYSVPSVTSSAELVAACVMGGFASPLSKSAPRGATIESTWLYFSNDGGRTFKAGPEVAKRPTFSSGVLAAPAPDVILLDLSGANTEALWGSFDGGHHFRVVYRGDVASLEFPYPNDGIGIVDSANGRTSLIATSDDGRHWHAVAF